MIESDDHTFYCIIVVVTVDLETKSHKKDMMKAKYFCKSKFASGVTQGDAFSKKKVHIYIQNLFIIDVHLGKENSLRMGMLLIFIFYFFRLILDFFYLFFIFFEAAGEDCIFFCGIVKTGSVVSGCQWPIV